MRHSIVLISACFLSYCLGGIASLNAQDPASSEPLVGLRDLSPQLVALENIDVVVRPGRTLEGATILLRDGSIVAVGTDLEIPAGTERLDRSGHTAYAGLIDAYSEVEVPDPSRDAGAPNWNGNVMPQRSTATVASGGLLDGKKLRSQGITVRLLAPEGGIVKGQSSVVLTGEGTSDKVLVVEPGWQHLSLTVPRRRGGGRDGYPNSPMGAVALLRQSLLDANWYRDAVAAYQADGTLPKPKRDVGLESLGESLRSMTFVIDAPNERMAQRADKIAKEFRLNIILRGSGREYRQLSEIAAEGHPILLPVDFADSPKIDDAAGARETSLQELLDWKLSPSNPARLAEAGVMFCLTTDGLEDAGKFLGQVRKAVEAGLDADAALAAMTTNPAELLRISDWAGTVEAGKLANLLITDGELFEKKTKIIETWVAGQRYQVTSPENKSLESIAGTWLLSGKLEADEPEETESLKLVLKKKGSSLSGTVSEVDDADEDEEEASEDDASEANTEDETEAETDEEGEEGKEEANEEEKPASVELKRVTRERDRLTASIDLSEIDSDFAAGVSWISLLTLDNEDSLEVVSGSIRLPNGSTIAIEVARFEEVEEQDEQAETAGANKESEETGEAEETEDAEEAEETEGAGEAEETEEGDEEPAYDVVYPLGAYGISETPEAPAAVLFRGGTVWTSAEAGILETTDVLVIDGKIAAVGNDLEVPENCEVIDITGKHLTPGLIDCHSHMATDGGVNESGQTITAEVRIEDFIDNSDISIYRQLAGGLTTSNILHGSANPIGGQNQVIKLRWGGTMAEMLFENAPKGVKFALGENVKRSRGRYPDSRMGVEQIIRDQLLAAREYRDAQQRYQKGDRTMLPPRTDLQMEALAEILLGDRWIHCHSYRQDEIVALLDVLDEFGITIGSLQHILEGYKVADRMKAHGATASSFSDWWAYKFEVYDAIPYNGALMHDVGIVVSFNSDDAELARHMNTEAAKAVKYGGVPAAEALKFVTLNPAKQLRIDDRVGSIEVGKDADIAIWSRSPLSTMTRCEQTWVDGCCYFSLEKDADLRARDARWHAMLVQEILAGKTTGNGARKERVEEEDRWHRHDIYCQHHDHEGLALEDHAHEEHAAEEARQ